MASRPTQIKPVKRRNFSARGKRFRHLDEVLALIANGMSVKAACRSRPYFPTAAQFAGRLLTDAALRARFNAACPRAGQSCPNLAALEHADEMLNLIEGGMSVRQVCKSDSRFPARDTFVAALKYNPKLELRYDLAMVRATRPHAKALAAFDEIERRIIGGGTVLGILNSDRTRFPSYSAFTKMLAARPDLDARYRAAGRAREAGPLALKSGPKYSPSEIRIAATTFLLSDERSTIYKTRLSPGGIHVHTLLQVRHRSPELLVAVETALVARRSRLKMSNGRLKIDYTNVRIVEPGAVLTLSSNEVWRRAAAAVPRAIDSHIRDDVISQLVIALLEGSLDLSSTAKEAKRLIALRTREMFYGDASLDKPFNVDSTFSLLDTLQNRWG